MKVFTNRVTNIIFKKYKYITYTKYAFIKYVHVFNAFISLAI